MKNRRNGETIFELLMTYVAPVIGASLTIVVLNRSTTLPKWLCVALGLPIGTILGWVGMLGIAFVFFVIASKIGSANTYERREKQ